MCIIYMLSGPGKSTGFPEKIKESLKEDLMSKKILFLFQQLQIILKKMIYMSMVIMKV